MSVNAPLIRPGVGLVLTHVPASDSGAVATSAAITVLTGLDRHGVTNRLAGLVRRGLVVRIGKYEFQRTAAGDGAAADPMFLVGRRQSQRRRLGNPEGLLERLWRALRIERRATLADLLELAARGETTAAAMGRHYLLLLARYGIVARQKVGKRPYVYSLVRDLGALAPLWSELRQELYDRNAMRPIPLEMAP